MKSQTRNLVMCALCAAVICILSPLSIPIGPVPISLATFAVMLSGALLGAKWGTVATLVYILLGAVGVPVFAGWTGGAAIIAGPTGGYIIGYLPLAFLTGLFCDLFGRNKSGVMKYVWMAAGMLLGNLVLYILGTAWFIGVKGASLKDAMAWCVTPFIPGDIAKMVIVAIVVPAIEKALGRAGYRIGGAGARA